jgi:TolB-like protein
MNTTIEERIASKVDYRLIEINNISPSAEVQAIIITSRPPSSDVVEDVKRVVHIIAVFPFLSTIKVKGKVRDILSLTEKDYVKYIVLEEILAKIEEFF